MIHVPPPAPWNRYTPSGVAASLRKRKKAAAMAQAVEQAQKASGEKVRDPKTQVFYQHRTIERLEWPVYTLSASLWLSSYPLCVIRFGEWDDADLSRCCLLCYAMACAMKPM